MDDLFRFVSVRPAQTTTAKAVVIQGETPFQTFVRERLFELHQPRLEATRTLTAADKWKITREAAQEWVANRGNLPAVVTDITQLNLHEKYAKLRTNLESTKKHHDLAKTESSIAHVFGSPSSDVVEDRLFRQDLDQVWDSIVLIFLLPALQRNPFAALCEVAQIMDIIARAAAQDQTLNDPLAVQAALSATIILPQDLLPADTDRLRPVGVADLLVVKQHIERYELGEIVNIENILKGESRRKVNKHGLTNERTLMVDKTTTTETVTDVSTSERFSLKRESDNTIKEDINAKAGVNISSKYGTTSFSANASLDYAKSKSDSEKVSSDYAKDVVSRASTKVTESIRVQQTTRVLETFEEDEFHTFDNTGGTENVSGIYQWVNKIYKAQVFNYGKRLLFDIMVPEPAALLLDAANISIQTGVPQPPKPFTATPSDLREGPLATGYYGQYLTEYDVEGVDPPPLDNISVAKTFIFTAGDKKDHRVNNNAEVTIPEGYEATSVYVDLTWNYTTEDSNAVSVYVGNVKFEWRKQDTSNDDPPVRTLPLPATAAPSKAYIPLSPACAGTVAMAVGASPEGGVGDYSVVVELNCSPTATAIEMWRLKTHGKILGAYNQKLRDYQDALASRKLNPPAIGPLGSNNPDTNRITERTEMKRNAIQLLTQNDLLGFIDVQTDPPPATSTPGDPPPQSFPRPNYVQAVQDGNFARFCEQAFEWEQMQYIFYPYYWSRREIWYEKLMLMNDDPLFAQFLQAGQARAVIPVRPSMEPAVWYYLMTGDVWMGGDPPMVTDSDYLNIAEEIKEQADPQGGETPYGDPWEVSVPTTLIKLREGDSIEDVVWELKDPWTWTAKADSAPSPGKSGAVAKQKPRET